MLTEHGYTDARYKLSCILYTDTPTPITKVKLKVRNGSLTLAQLLSSTALLRGAVTQI